MQITPYQIITFTDQTGVYLPIDVFINQSYIIDTVVVDGFRTMSLQKLIVTNNDRLKDLKADYDYMTRSVYDPIEINKTVVKHNRIAQRLTSLAICYNDQK
jgi:hypothetical protein